MDQRREATGLCGALLPGFTNELTNKKQLQTKILAKKYIKIFKRFRVLTSTGLVILDLIDFDIRL